jgi:glutamate racemase
VTRALIFDSGVGGLSVLDAMVEAGLAITIDYAADNAWLPYGAKSDADLRARTPSLIRALTRTLRPDIVVLACNTASTIVLPETRAAIPMPVVGVVPPIKPAAARSRSGVIGLLATEATIGRSYTNDLIQSFAGTATLISVAATPLVSCAEAKLAGVQPDPAAIVAAISALFEAPRGGELDVVALACTHFPLLREELAARAPRPVLWLDSGEAVARRVQAVSGCPRGRVETHRAAFTDARAAGPLAGAFAARGFSEFCAIGPTPDFSLALHSPPLSI